MAHSTLPRQLPAKWPHKSHKEDQLSESPQYLPWLAEECSGSSRSSSFFSFLFLSRSSPSSRIFAEVLCSREIYRKFMSWPRIRNADSEFMTRTHYTPTKAGILSLMQSCAVALGKSSIRCNAILPGTIRTQMNEADLSNEKKRMAMEERIPLGRLGVPEDLVGPALFLASSMSQYVVSPHLRYLPQRIGGRTMLTCQDWRPIAR